MDVVILILSIVLLAVMNYAMGYHSGVKRERKKCASLIEDIFKVNNYLRNTLLGIIGRKRILVSTVKGETGWHCYANEFEGVDGFGRTREEAMDDYEKRLEDMLSETGIYKGVKLAIIFQPNE